MDDLRMLGIDVDDVAFVRKWFFVAATFNIAFTWCTSVIYP
jgi:hypothetical protein